MINPFISEIQTHIAKFTNVVNHFRHHYLAVIMVVAQSVVAGTVVCVDLLT